MGKIPDTHGRNAEIFMTGFFITFEGGEGAGKTTQSKRLRSFLESLSREVILTREPGGTPEAEKIRDLLVQRDGGNWTPMAECAMFFAARQMHIDQLIMPALMDDKIVICDRFTDSTRAYQGYGHGFDLQVIEELKSIIIGGFEPDLTFVFDLPVEEGLKRSMSQKKAAGGAESSEDKYEKMDIGFHQRMREGFREIAFDNPDRCHVIDAMKTPDDIFTDISRIVRDRLDHAV